MLFAKLKQLLLLVIFTATLLPTALRAQNVTERFTNSGFGTKMTQVRQPSEIVTLDETSICYTSPSKHYPYQANEATLHVVKHIMGISKDYAIPMPSANDPHGNWHKPYRLTSTSVVIPATGPDGQYGTVDDALILFSGLDFPGAPVVRYYPIGGPGPRNSQDLLILNEGVVAWIGEGAIPGYLNGDEVIYYADISTTAFVRRVATLSSFTSGMTALDNYVAPMDPGEFALRFTGPDMTMGTYDDAIGMIYLDSNQDSLACRYLSVGHPVMFYDNGENFPRHSTADGLVIPDGGLDGDIGNEDDWLTFVSRMKTAPVMMTVPVYAEALAKAGRSPRQVVSLSDGTQVIPGPGMDEVYGTADDTVVVAGPFASPAQSTVIGSAVANGNDVSPGKPIVLSSDIALIPTYGSTGFADIDDGVAVLRYDAVAKTYAVSNYPFFEVVDQIVPLDETSVLVFLANGSCVRLSNLDQATPSSVGLVGAPYSFESKVTPVNPGLAVCHRTGPQNPDGSFNNFLQFWRTPAHFTYGKSTPNNAGHALKIGLNASSAPKVGGTPYYVTLTGAPANQNAIILASIQRDNLLVLADVQISLKLEMLVAALPWATFANGTTSYPFVPPTNPYLQGLGIHFQWFVYDASSWRGFEMSDALTITY